MGRRRSRQGSGDVSTRPDRRRTKDSSVARAGGSGECANNVLSTHDRNRAENPSRTVDGGCGCLGGVGAREIAGVARKARVAQWQHAAPDRARAKPRFGFSWASTGPGPFPASPCAGTGPISFAPAVLPVTNAAATPPARPDHRRSSPLPPSASASSSSSLSHTLLHTLSLSPSHAPSGQRLRRFAELPTRPSHTARRPAPPQLDPQHRPPRMPSALPRSLSSCPS